MNYELCDTGYGILVNGTEFASSEEWIECEIIDDGDAPLTEFVDKKKGESDAENRHVLCQSEAV